MTKTDTHRWKTVGCCSAKTRRNTIRRRRLKEKTMHIQFLVDRHDGHHHFFSLLLRSFLLPLYCPLLVHIFRVCFFLLPFQMNTDMRTSFFFRSSFIVFIIAIVIIVAIVIVLYFVGILSDFSVCKWVYSARPRTSMRTNVMREHLAQRMVCTTRKAWPVLFEWIKWIGYTAWMER